MPTSPTIFRGRDPSLSAGGEKEGWGDCSTDELWDYESAVDAYKTFCIM
ncbi:MULTISPECIES: hypothetical protein [unclassified Mesorhizobium]|nr:MULTISPECIES: hypothetical protein [unclassified Mesorhizobium]